MAVFANLTLPTQAALPEMGPADWAAPESAHSTDFFGEDNTGSRIVSAPARTGRWWSVGRALWDASGAETLDPDLAIERGFATVAPERLAGFAPARPDPVIDGRVDASEIAYTPYQAKKVVWSPVAFYAIPPLGKGDHAWMKKPLPAQIYSAKEQTCLATAIYFEARGESERGQAAVAQVILNRVRSPAYPDTACGVVYQNAAKRNQCQFSFACDGIKDRIRKPSVYERAKKIAMAVTSGEIFVSEVGSSTHYFANYVRPRWANSMVKMASIGDHEFFRTVSGGWK
jgi:hypothetical protein